MLREWKAERIVGEAGWGLAVAALLLGCAQQAAAPTETKLPPDVHLLSAKSQRDEWCRSSLVTQSECHDFRDVPPQEIVRFEQGFPALLQARGRALEAKRLHEFDRTYWGVFENGRLEVLGVLVCRDRLGADGESIYLEPNPGGGCAEIRVTFPAGHPEQAAFTVE